MLCLLQPKSDFFEAGHCENSLCNLWSRRTAGKACSMAGAKAEGAQIGLACRGAVLPQRVMHGRACQPGAWDVGMNLAGPVGVPPPAWGPCNLWPLSHWELPLCPQNWCLGLCSLILRSLAQRGGQPGLTERWKMEGGKSHKKWCLLTQH